MFPIICQFGPVTVYSYGFMLAVAALVCTFLASRDAKRSAFRPGLSLILFFGRLSRGF